MALTLPYEFDSSAVVKVILKLVLGLLAVAIIGIAYTLLISHNLLGASLLLLVAVFVTGFARLVLRHLAAAQGTIRAEARGCAPGHAVRLPTAGIYGQLFHRAVRSRARRALLRPG
ncbi:MAG: hypothetical protein ACRENP_25200 [Longimicrobiales bacterium]